MPLQVLNSTITVPSDEFYFLALWTSLFKTSSQPAQLSGWLKVILDDVQVSSHGTCACNMGYSTHTCSGATTEG